MAIILRSSEIDVLCMFSVFPDNPEAYSIKHSSILKSLGDRTVDGVMFSLQVPLRVLFRMSVFLVLLSLT
jgi:hypothetical protein